MILSPYSLFTALLYFSLFLLVGGLLRRRFGALSRGGALPLLLLLALCALRVALPVEFPFTRVIESRQLLPALIRGLTDPLPVLGLSLGGLLLLAWGAGAVAGLLCLAVQLGRDRRTLRTVSAVDDPRAAACLRELAPGPVRLVISREISAPLVVGLVQPVILLPPTRELSQQSLRHFLTHELCHIRNGDQWLKLLARLLRCLLWWNPAAWWLERSLEDALELRCDRAVTRHMKPREKAEYLKAVALAADGIGASGACPPFVLASGLVDGGSGEAALKERFQLVCGKSGVTKASVAFMATACLVFCLSYLAVVQPRFESPIPVSAGTPVTPENGYLLDDGSGEYALYVDGEFFMCVPKGELDQFSLNGLSIVKNQEEFK